MSDIQRWTWAPVGALPSPDGSFVTYADHVEALRQAREGWAAENFPTGYGLGLIDGREQGQRDALAAVLSDMQARLQREIDEGDGDGLRDGLLYVVEVLKRQTKGDSDE